MLLKNCNYKMLLLANLKKPLFFKRLLPEDTEFKNMIDQAESQRLHLVRERKRMAVTDQNSGLDLYNPKAGVIFVNLSDRLGYIEKISKGTKVK